MALSWGWAQELVSLERQGGALPGEVRGGAKAGICVGECRGAELGEGRGGARSAAASSSQSFWCTGLPLDWYRNRLSLRLLGCGLRGGRALLLLGQRIGSLDLLQLMTNVTWWRVLPCLRQDLRS